MTKSWLLAGAFIPLVVWVFARVPQRILPQMMTTGTTQIIIQWRDALAAYHEEFGHYPEALEGRTQEDSRAFALSGTNPKSKKFLDLSSVVIHYAYPMDGWDHKLHFDPDKTGDDTHIISDGPDGLPHTADDIDSAHLPSQAVSSKPHKAAK